MTNARLVVTNATGWELNDELAEWAKLDILWSHLDIPVSDVFRKNIEDGRNLWVALVSAIHSGERADKEDEARAVVWRKHAKKDRRKITRRARRDGIPDPFELPDMGVRELNAWITEGQKPEWVRQLEVDEGEAPQSEPELDFDAERFFAELDAAYENDLAALIDGPRAPEGPDGEILARLHGALRTRLAAIEEGREPLPDPAPGARRRYIALEEREIHEERDDLADFRAANWLAIGIGVLIRELEGADAAPISEEFIRALGPASGDPVSVTPRLMELASLSRDFRGPPDEHGHPSRGTDALLLSLFGPGENVWDAIEWWAEEYVRLTTMSVPGFAVVMNRPEAIRFGYMLACYLELGRT